MGSERPPFDEGAYQERLARNEARFREINEGIERGRDPYDDQHLVGFVCECALRDCTRIVELTPAEYEAVRADPACFVVTSGHEIPDVERTLERHDRYSVVRKHPPGASVAEDLDTRS